MTTAAWVAELLWNLGRKLDAHRRKRPPGDEDHYYPANPNKLGLVRHQCYFCREVSQKEPKRGCHGPAKPQPSEG